MTDMDIWVGEQYQARRIFVLGESWYGTFSKELTTDAGYIAAYLAGRVSDRMYSKMANACGQPRTDFWRSVAFTNFVQCVGKEASARPTIHAYKKAQARLSRLLEIYRPHAVWILGEEQAKYSGPVIESMGVHFEVTWHPMRVGCTNARLHESWGRLLKKLSSEKTNSATAIDKAETLIPDNSQRRARFMNQTADIVKKIFTLSGELEALHPGRKFTPDGHMVGSIGEVLAAEMYNLKLLPASSETHDAIDNTGKKWQIKLTSGCAVALRSEPEWLLVMKLSKDGTVEEVFNGPGCMAWGLAGKMQKNGQRPVSLFKLRSSKQRPSETR